jgi:hypothetical protein
MAKLRTVKNGSDEREYDETAKDDCPLDTTGT